MGYVNVPNAILRFELTSGNGQRWLAGGMVKLHIHSELARASAETRDASENHPSKTHDSTPKVEPEPEPDVEPAIVDADSKEDEFNSVGGQ